MRNRNGWLTQAAHGKGPQETRPADEAYKLPKAGKGKRKPQRDESGRNKKFFWPKAAKFKRRKETRLFLNMGSLLHSPIE